MLNKLRRSIRPEFLNRIDDVLLFSPLTLKEIEQIVALQLNRLKKRFEDQKINLSSDPAAIRLLAKWSFDPLYGGRPVKRTIQEKILNPVSRLLLSKEKSETQNLKINVENDNLQFQFRETQ